MGSKKLASRAETEAERRLEEVEGEMEVMKRGVAPEEVRLIGNYLDRFILNTGSTSREDVDLKLALKALPSRINSFNVYRIDLMNFNQVQKALIAF